jgi:hypothetical protein
MHEPACCLSTHVHLLASFLDHKISDLARSSFVLFPVHFLGLSNLVLSQRPRSAMFHRELTATSSVIDHMVLL